MAPSRKKSWQGSRDSNPKIRLWRPTVFQLSLPPYIQVTPTRSPANGLEKHEFFLVVSFPSSCSQIQLTNGSTYEPNLAGAAGLEPAVTGLEPVGLPLAYAPKGASESLLSKEEPYRHLTMPDLPSSLLCGSLPLACSNSSRPNESPHRMAAGIGKSLSNSVLTRDL